MNEKMANDDSPPVQTQTFHMVALDLDGTLLASNHTLTDETVQYLRELDANGFHVVIATGRSATSVYAHVHRLGISPIHVVCSNGGRGLLCHIHHHHHHHHPDEATAAAAVTPPTLTVKELFSTPVPRNVTLQTIELATELGHVTQYYVGEDIYANPTTPVHRTLTELYMELTGSHVHYVTDNFACAMLDQGLPSKMLVLCPVEQQAAMMDAFYPVFVDADDHMKKTATIIHGSMRWFLEVLHPDVCKGQGLQRMCQHMNVNIDTVVAFGDGDNDLEFIQFAGRGIVMKNGRDVVKQVADEVIDFTNDEEGVRRTLQRMQQNGQLVMTRPVSNK
jgi:hydroxymethylpyrimidine pyrophosphatase-like HAD family hydrolase